MTGLPPGYARTRAALHAVAEQVLARARYEATGRIGLRPWPGGFATAAFPSASGGRTVVGVRGVELVVVHDGVERVAQLTTLAAAAGMVGVAPAAPDVYPAQTHDRDPRAALDLDPVAAAAVADWFALGARVLAAFTAELDPGDAAEPVVLWPEHFDLAMAAGPEGRRATYGLSPGDAGVPGPYVYVAPYEPPRPDPFWDATTFVGAVRTYPQVVGGADPDGRALALLRDARALLRDTPGA